MLIATLAIIAGFALLVWSADRFVEGAAATARHAGMPPLLIGMVIVGFGTSAPEMVVSALAAQQGNPNLALGNAYGSNITNIALILGTTALLAPIAVHSKVVRKELPLLLALSLLSGGLLWDGALSRLDAGLLLTLFVALMGWSVFTAMRNRGDVLDQEMEDELTTHAMPIGRALCWLVVGLLLLVVSSRLLVWGAVSIAQSLGVSDLIIGLTIVALGTSLPELAASVIAARKGEHDIALGNVLGSNMFNLLTVVGIAGMIHPFPVVAEVMSRDWPVLIGLTVALFAMGYGPHGQGRINRLEGSLLLVAYVAYIGWLVHAAVPVG